MIAPHMTGNNAIENFQQLVADAPSEFEKIIQRVVIGESLRDVCAALHLPYARVFHWIANDCQKYLIYQRALLEGALNRSHAIL